MCGRSTHRDRDSLQFIDTDKPPLMNSRLHNYHHSVSVMQEQQVLRGIVGVLFQKNELQVCMSRIVQLYLNPCVCVIQEEVRKLRVQTEEVVQENEKLHEQLGRMGGISHQEW